MWLGGGLRLRSAERAHRAGGEPDVVDGAYELAVAGGVGRLYAQHGLVRRPQIAWVPRHPTLPICFQAQQVIIMSKHPPYSSVLITEMQHTGPSMSGIAVSGLGDCNNAVAAVTALAMPQSGRHGPSHTSLTLLCRHHREFFITTSTMGSTPLKPVQTTSQQPHTKPNKNAFTHPSPILSRVLSGAETKEFLTVKRGGPEEWSEAED